MARRGIGAISVAVCLISFALPSAAVSPRPVFKAGAHSSGADTWSGTPTFLSGTSTYDAGEWIYTDFVYDDGGRAGNRGDIVEVRARANGDDLALRVVLNSLTDPTEPRVWVALGRGSTPVDWPGAALRSSAQQVHTVAATSAGTSCRRSRCPAHVLIDADANTVSFTLPRAAAGRSVLLNVAAGAAGHEGAVDLAFNTRTAEAGGRDVAQTGALTDGSVDRFAQTIDIGRLRSGRSGRSSAQPGLYDRVVRSVTDLGEGYGDEFPRFRGRYQPYALWIPRTSALTPGSSRPLLLLLHSLGADHRQYAAYPNLYRRLGEELGAYVATPLALGEDGWYVGPALHDSVHVLDDVLASFPVDTERVWVGGYSMGGFGTDRLVAHLPGRFAASLVWGGVNATTTHRQVVEALAGPPLLPSPLGDDHARVPTLVLHGSDDELVPLAGAVERVARSVARGGPARLHVVAGGHLVFAERDDWTLEREWLRSRRRVS